MSGPAEQAPAVLGKVPRRGLVLAVLAFGLATPSDALAAPADAPAGVTLGGATATSLFLSWTAGNLNDCIFSKWTVLVRAASSGTWYANPGCPGFIQAQTFCTLSGLAPLTPYYARVSVSCTSGADDSFPVVSNVMSTLCDDDLQCTSGYYCDADGHCVHEPARVDLLDFSGQQTATGVLLSWQTATEDGCGAFTVLRCDRSQRDCVAVADHVEVAGIVVPCEDSPGGWAYAATDGTAAADARYSYYLREHTTTGGTHDYGPALVGPLLAAASSATPAVSGPGAGSAGRAAGCSVGGRPRAVLPLLLLAAVVAIGRGRRF
jgi:hypothetical protein